ncbi:MAG: MerR family transcriptional regulator [Anaerolineae bacterium]|nr:MerR family transcriptional regulator [Anaerolineae bacterium]
MNKTGTNQYQVSEVAACAGVSPRTLHYYDEIGLLTPTGVAENGYRFYDEQALLRLQQILLYKEFGFSLSEILQILDDPNFDLLQALEKHQDRLLRRIEQLEKQLSIIDHTIEFIKGERTMAKEEFFSSQYDPAQQEIYEEEIRQKYGEKQWRQSRQRWDSYSEQKRKEIMAEGNQVTLAIFESMSKGHDHPETQAHLARYHQFMQYFYDCTLEIFEGLGRMYCDDPRFRVLYEAKHPDFPEFMRDAMQYYANQQRTKA